MALWRRHVSCIKGKLDFFFSSDSRKQLLQCRKSATAFACRQLERVSAPSYLEELRGTIGADPFRFANP